MNRSLFCGLCWRDRDTGETFCVRLGEWVENCPFRKDGTPWNTEKIDLSETKNEGKQQ